jgi:hypothetical protein
VHRPVQPAIERRQGLVSADDDRTDHRLVEHRDHVSSTSGDGRARDAGIAGVYPAARVTPTDQEKPIRRRRR